MLMHRNTEEMGGGWRLKDKVCRRYNLSVTQRERERSGRARYGGGGLVGGLWRDEKEGIRGHSVTE